MKYLNYLLITLVLVVGCGKQTCTSNYENSSTDRFGILEKMKCPAGEMISSVVPNYIAGGIVTDYTVQCVKAVVRCL